MYNGNQWDLVGEINTDTKVTSVENHYVPEEDTTKELSANATSTTSADWGTTDLVTGVNLQRDAAGHVTGITVDSIQMPANPNTDNAHQHDVGVGLAFEDAERGGTSGTVTYKAKLKSEDAVTKTEKVYPVAVDSQGDLVVNVPWENTQDGNYNQTVTTGNVTFGNNDPIEFVAGQVTTYFHLI